MTAPVRLCCGTSHFGPVCPDGKVMCQLCFSRFSLDDLYTDSSGDTWDECQECGQANELAQRDKRDDS